MNVKPAEIRHFGAYERKNEGVQQDHNQGWGIPLLTFLHSYISFLQHNISDLLSIGAILRGATHSYVAKPGLLLGRAVELWAWRTYHPPRQIVIERFLSSQFALSHIPAHNVSQDLPQ